MTADWVVLLELTPMGGMETADREAVHAVLRAFADADPAAILADDRWALQVHVTAGGPGEAVLAASSRWREAEAALSMRRWQLVRAEVTTAAEFHRECATVAPHGPVDASPASHAADEVFEALFRDPLTGLATRPVFSDSLTRALSAGAAAGRQHAVLIVDFQGRLATDDVRSLVTRLTSALRGEDLVARMDTGRIGVLLRNATVNVAQSVATRLVQGVRLTPPAGDSRLPVSVGVAFGHTGQRAEDLVHEAAVAATMARRAGGDRHVMLTRAGAGAGSTPSLNDP
ncbi:MAG TPA: GGDEF domain-containing protein [Egibacteraceae bacterium]|nr:GGDEF domain-containing protein [Egibacteraceae bacterium]